MQKHQNNRESVSQAYKRAYKWVQKGRTRSHTESSEKASSSERITMCCGIGSRSAMLSMRAPENAPLRWLPAEPAPAKAGPSGTAPLSSCMFANALRWPRVTGEPATRSLWEAFRTAPENALRRLLTELKPQLDRSSSGFCMSCIPAYAATGRLLVSWSLCSCMFAKASRGRLLTGDAPSDSSSTRCIPEYTLRRALPADPSKFHSCRAGEFATSLLSAVSRTNSLRWAGECCCCHALPAAGLPVCTLVLPGCCLAASLLPPKKLDTQE